MGNIVQPMGLRRADWDFTGRTKPLVDVLLRQLGEEKDPAERRGIVDRLTSYVRGFDDAQVDYAHLNAGLRAAGFAELAHTPPTGPKRPLSEMSPADRAALDRAERFLGYEVPQAGKWVSEEAKGRVAELGRVVRSTCGDFMTEDEFRTAMSMLNLARK